MCFIRLLEMGGNFQLFRNGRSKHSDNHALWIDPANTEHMLAGSDGGLYESFDEGKNWRFLSNLPIAQFYKIGVDNTEPFTMWWQELRI